MQHLSFEHRPGQDLSDPTPSTVISLQDTETTELVDRILNSRNSSLLQIR